jgi:hypothetical protein
VYDPADLAAIIQNKMNSYDPIPKSEWNVAYDGLSDPDLGQSGFDLHSHYVTWDPIAKQILVAIDDVSGSPNHQPRVYVHGIP